VGESQEDHLVVVFAQAVDGLLGIEVPADNVGVLAALARCQHVAGVRNCEASYLIVVRGHEVLIMGVLDVPDHD
jgi:hypothetical protein